MADQFFHLPDTSNVVALTDAPVIAVDASRANHCRVTIAGNRTMGVPVSPMMDGQKLTFEIIQDASGNRTMAWASGPGGYTFLTGLPVPVLSIAANAHDFVGFIYNATMNTWYCLAFMNGG